MILFVNNILKIKKDQSNIYMPYSIGKWKYLFVQKSHAFFALLSLTHIKQMGMALTKIQT